MRNNEPDGRTAGDTTRGRKPVGRTARGQASGLCATQRRGAARAFAWPTSGARLDAQSRSQSASIDPRWAGGPFVAPSLRSPRRRWWWSTMRHWLGQANASPAPRRCVAQRPEACPLAARPTGVAAARRMGRRVAAVRYTGVPAARRATCPLATRTCVHLLRITWEGRSAPVTRATSPSAPRAVPRATLPTLPRAVALGPSRRTTLAAHAERGRALRAPSDARLRASLAAGLPTRRGAKRVFTGSFALRLHSSLAAGFIPAVEKTASSPGSSSPVACGGFHTRRGAKRGFIGFSFLRCPSPAAVAPIAHSPRQPARSTSALCARTLARTRDATQLWTPRRLFALLSSPSRAARLAVVLERATGFEPATASLGSSYSTS